MALNQLANINVEVSKLMNESVEGLWQEADINSNLNTTGVHSLGFHSSSKPYVSPAHDLAEAMV
jgi:hypothetical protein